MHENLQINVHSRRRFMEYLIHHAQYVGQYLYVKIASVTDMCVCVSVPDVWIIILCGYMQFNLIGAKHA